jgi:hypothetical protein
MNNDLKIEYYLSQLDRELQAFSVSQRAEIVTEIKSHIHESMNREGAKPIDQILKDLGGPRQVAERYLVAKGMPLAPPRRSGKVFKWLAIGTVGFFALLFFGGIMAAIYLRPFVKVDGTNGEVKILGGLIDVNVKDDLGQVKIGEFTLSDKGIDGGAVIQGKEDISGKQVKIVRIPFNTAKLEIKYNTDSLLNWECKAPSGSGVAPETQAGVLTLNLDKLNLAKCSISLPAGIEVQFRGVNGHMDVEHPSENVDIELNNGKVQIHPDPAVAYDFDVKVKNGLQDFFPRSKDKNAVKVKVSVVNGLVKKE